MTLAFPQELSSPPHCKANNSKVKPGVSSEVPMGSNSWIRRFSDSSDCCLGAGLEGKRSSRRTRAIPPIGRLIQKHQRHVVLVAKTPPRSGPAIAAMPNVAARRPWYFGRFSNGRRSTKRTWPPVEMPAQPMPAMARPMMKAMLFGAAAQSTEPTSNMKTNMLNAHFDRKKVWPYKSQLVHGEVGGWAAIHRSCPWAAAGQQT